MNTNRWKNSGYDEYLRVLGSVLIYLSPVDNNPFTK